MGLKLALQAFVVLVGFLILSGAVNTSIVGSNGVLNRLAEDGVLTPWFLHPQARFGTTHRLINAVALLQIITIVASLGDVYTLAKLTHSASSGRSSSRHWPWSFSVQEQGAAGV